MAPLGLMTVMHDDEWAPASPGHEPARRNPAGHEPAGRQPTGSEPAGREWVPVARGGDSQVEVSPPTFARGPPGAPPDFVKGPGPELGARKRSGTIGWDIMLGLDLGLVGLLAIANIALFFFPAAIEAATPEGDAATSAIILNTVVSAFLFGIIPFVWILGTREGGWEGAKKFLHLHDTTRSFLMSIPIAVGLVIVIIAVSFALQAMGLEEESTQNIEALLAGLTWPVAIFVAIVAGVGEEIMFRGVLQRWLGWVGQGVVFGFMHVANGITALVVTMAIGLFFGYLMKRGRSLWLLIGIHFVYDMILLAAALLFPEFGG